jgi:hypothetical protein
MSARKYICPKCKEKTGVNIQYGYPSFECREKELKGEVVLGGCMIEEGQPERACASCEHEWRIKRRDPFFIELVATVGSD